MRTLEEIRSNKQLQIQESWEQELVTYVRGYFFDPVTQKRWFFIFTKSLGWEHLSISQPNKTPTWDVMCRVKDIFWRGDEACVEYHPKEEDYVNMHEHCLHIWRPYLDELPTPPPIMVGFTDVNSDEAKKASEIFINSMSDEELLETAKEKGINVGNRVMKRKVGMK